MFHFAREKSHPSQLFPKAHSVWPQQPACGVLQGGELDGFQELVSEGLPWCG